MQYTPVTSTQPGLRQGAQAAVDVSTGVVTAVGAGGAVLAAGASAPMTAAVSSLLAAAGVSASVPVAGWIAAGVAATGAGLVALVAALRGARVRRTEAVAWAESLGIANASSVPGFVVRVSRMTLGQRIRLGEQLSARLARTRLPKARARIEVERAIIGQLIYLDLGAASPARIAPPAASPQALERAYGDSSTHYLLAGGAVATAALALFIFTR
jgi:hypothetical protein